MSDVDVRTVLNLAIGLADGHITADQIVRALKVGGYQIVSAASGAESGAGAGVDSAAPRPPSSHGRLPPPVPQRWPKQCSKCNKIVTDQASLEIVCDRGDCPL